uniref:Uncharacterized protein n=1 Tax=Oryza barthii TaxID=65489 RepID=A0A0D3H1G9_9ORYZ
MEWELEREMVLMAAAGGEHQKKQRQQQPARRAFATDLLQNCDLPPPAKLFGPLPTLQRGAAGAAGSAKEGVGEDEDEDEDEDGGARRGAAAWWLALAVCVGIAGIGLAMGKLLL